MKLWQILCLLLLIPVVAAQQYPILETNLVQHELLHSESFNLKTTFPCEGGDWVAVDDKTIRYRESETGSSCAEIRTALTIPEDATGMTISMEADRYLTYRVSTSPIYPVVQQVRLYAGADDTEPIAGGTWDYFEPEEDGDPVLRQLAHVVPQHIVQNYTALYLGIYVQELGPASPVEETVPLPVGSPGLPGQSIVATVRNVDVGFSGIEPDLFTAVRHEGVAKNHELLSGIAGVNIPDDKPYSITFRLQEGWLIERVDGPDQPLPRDQLAISSDGLSITIPTAVVAEHGEGGYQLYLTGEEHISTNAFMIIFMGLVVSTPLISGSVAVRGATTIWREARGANLGSIKTMQILLLVLGGIYIGLIFWIIFSPGWLMAVAWPLLPEAAMAHAIFLMISVVFLVLGLRWRRVLNRAIRTDLAEKQGILEELQRSNQELEQFAYVASHDLQEPLRMVSSYTDLLQRKYMGKLDSDGDQYLQFAREGSQRMAQLINDLLQFSRISTHGGKFEDVDLAETMEDVRQNLHVTLQDTGGKLVIGRMPVVDGDKIQLMRLFQNLIHNGLKFSAPDRPPVVKVQASREGPNWVITVSDNGIGINPKFFDKIFVIFQRLHSRAQYEGTGLGLALVKRITERHGGTIWVSSKEGKGTTFHIKLPEEHARGPLQ